MKEPIAVPLQVPREWMAHRSTEPRSQAFSEHCGTCHFDANGAGDVVPLASAGTDGAATLSSTRGSGGYRVPSLHRVSERTHLTHEGWPLTLEQFLEPERAATSPGHAFGLELTAAERRELLNELSRR
jgi:hypothetical protein